jgi:hypothetical protein
MKPRKNVIMCKEKKSQHYNYPCAQKMDKIVNGYEKTARCNSCLKQVMNDEFTTKVKDHSRGYK